MFRKATLSQAKEDLCVINTESKKSTQKQEL